MIHGGMELSPGTELERIFSILALFGAFLLAIWFAATSTSLMTRLFILTTGQAGHLKVLKRYLRENGISLRLASRVEMNAQHVIANRQQNVPESEVELLQLVSEPLRVE